MTIGTVGVYLLEVSTLLILFYIFNKQLLGRETLHRLNRYWWLSTTLLAFVLPFGVPLISLFAQNQAVGLLREELYEMDSGAIVPNAHGASNIETALIAIAAIYLTVAAILLVHNAISYTSLFRLIFNKRYDLARSTNIQEVELLKDLHTLQVQIGVKRCVRYVVHNENIAPFSWHNFVVLSRADIAKNCREIVIHELTHVEQRHSIDVLLLNAITIFLWFNPAAWLTKRAVQQVHEYCADESVLSLGVNAKEYQLLLIRKAVGGRLYTISNSLNHSNLKNRITMMLKKKSQSMAAAKCLYAIPLAIAAITLFSSPALAKTISAVTEVKVTNYFTEIKTDEPLDALYLIDDKVATKAQVEDLDPEDIERIDVNKDPAKATEYEPTGEYSGVISVTLKEGRKSPSTPEKMATFEGGDLRSFQTWVMSHIKYPTAAAKAGVQGTVTLSFVVDKNGTIGDIEVLQSPDEALSKEAIRVVKSSSKKWEPAIMNGKKVSTNYKLPVVFTTAY
ncbi:MAG: M56 family metallopeptidase [Rikenellaceae bacterium]